MDGKKVACDFQEHPQLNEIPTIFLTAPVEGELSNEGEQIKENGEELLAKPFRVETLLECMENRLQRG